MHRCIFQFASLSLFLGQPCFKPLLIFRILVETPNSVKQGGAQHSRISSGQQNLSPAHRHQRLHAPDEPEHP